MPGLQHYQERYLVADADGSVAFSLAVPSGSKCGFMPSGFGDGRFGFSVDGDGSSSEVDGVLAGDARGMYPTFMSQRPFESPQSAYVVSSNWVVRVHSQLYATTWDASQTIDIDGDPAGAPPRFWFATGNDVFFHVGNQTESGTLTWSQSTGTKLLLRWPGDISRATGNFGTDGLVMAWTYGEMHVDSQGQRSPVFSLMTAPYSTSPEVLQNSARRVRSDDGVTQYPYAVGCGYAARVDSQSGLRIARLSDGVSWTVPRDPTGFYFVQALGIGCNADGSNAETFAVVAGTKDYWEWVDDIVRIKVEALGSGTPAD